MAVLSDIGGTQSTTKTKAVEERPTGSCASTDCLMICRYIYQLYNKNNSLNSPTFTTLGFFDLQQLTIFLPLQLGDWLLCKVYLNEKEQLKTQVKLVSHPPPVASTSSLPPESSSSSSSRTSKQSTAMIESDSYIHRPDSKKIVIYYDDDVTTDMPFQQAE